MFMAINFGRVGIYHEEFPCTKSTGSFHHMVLAGHVNYFSCCITTTIKPMITKLGKVVTYYKKIQFIKSHDALNTWPHEVT